jgi:predicted AAA+ superfamily ATPase
MLQRTLAEKIASLASQFPVISITGPRQSGKTTLAKMVFDQHEYVTLEDPDEREYALNDPRGFLRRFKGSIILDEIQRTPELLSYIQGIVDSDDSPGRFILTGSQQFHLLHKISQTLAGRTALVHLLPFSIAELLSVKGPDPYKITTVPAEIQRPSFKLEEILYRGFYPRIHDKALDPHDWLSAYYRTYVERDVRDIIRLGDIDTFQRFVRLCAGRSGQLLNLSSLALDAGISHTTARSWLSVLQAGFIVHLLPPHHANFSKRLVKSPKLYFIDTGLLCYLLRIRKPEDILTHTMKGSIFETFVVADLFKAFVHWGETPPMYFWRDKTGHEVDIIIDIGEKLIPIEIKSGETVTSAFFDSIRYFRSLGKSMADTGVLIHGGDALYEREDCIVRPWHRAV